MRLKLFLVSSFILSILLFATIVHLVGQNFDLIKKEQYDTKLNLWILTPELEQSLSNFQTEENIKLKIKQFPNQLALLEELETAKISGNLPDIVEVEANELTEEFYDNMDPLQIDSSENQLRTNIHPAILKRFTYNNHLYGYPLGIEVPVMLINNSIIKNNYSYPFNTRMNYSNLEDYQSEVQQDYGKDNFWMYHTDENIAWYLSNDLLKTNEQSNFKNIWYELVGEYKLMPPLDHQMAMTRFANGEIAMLLTSSKNIKTMQPLVGNSFHLKAIPLRESEDDPLLVGGNGLMVINHIKESQTLFHYLEKDDHLEMLIAKNGLLPAQMKQLDDESYLRTLPVAKHLIPLSKEKDVFTGDVPLKKDYNEIDNIMHEYLTLEQESEGSNH